MGRQGKIYSCYSRKVYDRFCTKYFWVDVPYDKWKEVMRTFNSLFMEYIMKTGEKVKIPNGFGSLTIAKYKKKRYRIYEGKEYVNLSIDWPKTKAAGKYIYHLNNHTDGYNFRWYWFSTESRSIPTSFWIFKPSRFYSRGLAAYVNQNDKRNFDRYKQQRGGGK